MIWLVLRLINNLRVDNLWAKFGEVFLEINGANNVADIKGTSNRLLCPRSIRVVVRAGLIDGDKVLEDALVIVNLCGSAR